MKVTCLQENLARGLSIVSRAVATRSTLPVLGNVYMATENGRLRLSATNLELGITCWIGAKTEEDGSTTVPSRTFVDLINTLPNDQVEMDLSVRTQVLNVRSGPFTNDIKCIDAQEFPPMLPPDLDGGIVIPAEDLKEMISHVVFAASHDDARPVLTGVLVTIDNGEMTMAAADGFRLSVRTAHLATPEATLEKSIIPSRAMSELARILGDGDETVTMILPPDRGQVVFRTKSIEVVSQLIEGSYPDFQSIIPNSYETRAMVNTTAFLKACKAADIFARESAHSARLRFVPGPGGTLEVSATSAETGSNQTVVEATVEGEPVEIAFNVRFLVDVLNAVGTPNIYLETTSSSSPGLIRAAGRDDFLHVIMPMHLGK